MGSSRSKESDPLMLQNALRRHLARSAFRRYLYGAICLLLVFLAYRWISRRAEFTDEERIKMGYRGEMIASVGRSIPLSRSLGNIVKLEVYMEAQCPDTSRFIHKQLMRAWEKLGQSGRVEWSLVPFGKARCTEKDADFTCVCQHGESECILNQLMNCVIDKTKFAERYVPIVNCIQGERSLETAMTKCITAQHALDANEMRSCATGARGRRLLALAGALTVDLRPPLNFVPWIVLNGERVPDALYDLTENLCKKLQPAPEGCAEYSK